MGPLRRDGVPGPEIGVVDAFLRVVVAAEDVPGQGVEKTAVFSGGGRDGPLVPVPVKVNDLRVFQDPPSFLSL